MFENSSDKKKSPSLPNTNYGNQSVNQNDGTSGRFVYENTKEGRYYREPTTVFAKIEKKQESSGLDLHSEVLSQPTGIALIQKSETVPENTEKKQSSYYNVQDGEITSQDEVQATPSAPPSLIESFELIHTSEGKTYRVYQYVTKTQAQAIDKHYRIVLPIPHQERRARQKIPAYQGKEVSAYLGGGNFGRVYVGEYLTESGEPTGQFFAVKRVEGNLTEVIESAHEAMIQKELTQNQDPETSHLMPLIDAVEKQESGKLSGLYYLLPLAALGDAEKLREQLNTLENAELRRFHSNGFCKPK